MNFYEGFSSQTVFKNGWSIISGTYDDSNTPASYECSTSTNDQVNAFSPYYKLYPNGFKVITKKFEKPYQLVYVDILYFVKTEKFVNFALYDSNKQLNTASLKSTADINSKNQECYFKVSCNKSTKTDAIRESIFYNKQLTDKYPTVQFTYARATQNGDWFGILKTVIWSNCLENCYECVDQNNCKVCIKGFSIYTLSNGLKVCDENTGCNTTNCYSCIKNSDLNLNQCVKCLPGYILTNTNTCQAESSKVCATGQYYSGIDKNCVSYSTNCLMQVSGQYNKWKNCLQPIETSKIKCPIQKTVLIFELKNYQVYSCDCQVDFCEICSSIKPECQQCQAGYAYTSDKLKCQLCSVNNCLICKNGQPDICDVCQNNFQISSDKKSCKCDVQGCQTCQNNDGKKCNVCQKNYTFNQFQCTCQVKNCTTCNLNDGSLCDVCNPGLIFNATSKICECQIKNCQICSNILGQCKECVNHYKMSTDQATCSCDVDNCQQCDQQDGLQCTQCSPGYFIEISTKKCISSVKNCAQTDASNPQICLTCDNNFKLDTISNQCQCQINNCDLCQPNDGSICKFCIKNYSGPQCKCQVENCDLCQLTDGLKCNTCSSGYEIDSQFKCIVTCQLQDCEKCELPPLNMQQCNKCKDGFIVDNSTKKCIKQPCLADNCDECELLNNSKCKLCKDGYEININSQQCIKIQCLVTNCDECEQPITQQQCKKCKDGYMVDVYSKQCIIKCFVDNCNECEQSFSLNNQKCKICNDGYSVDTNTKQCIVECFLDNCIECELQLVLNNQQCKICKDGYFIDKNSKQCLIKSIIQNNFRAKQVKVSNGYNVTLTFDNEVVQKINETIFVFKISGISKYQYTFVDQKPKEVFVNIQVDQNCKGQTLVILINNTSFIQINNFQNNQKQITLDDYAYETNEQKKQAEVAKQASQSIQTTLISTMLPIAMIGNFYVLFNTIDLTTFIYFLLFLNIRYPSNVTNFCSVFQNFQMAFIPNLFQVYLTDQGYLQPYTPAKFLEYGNDAYFLNSAGQSYTIVFGILTIYLMLKLFSFLKIAGVQAYVQSKIESGWEYNAFFDLIWTVYMYVVVGVFLQFFSFEFTESLSFFNYTLFAMSLIAIFVIPICITIFIAKTPDLTEERIQKQFSSLVGGLKTSNYNNSPQFSINKLGNEKSEDEILNLKKQVSSNNIQGSSNHGQIIIDQQNQEGSIREQRTIKYSRYANVFLYFRKILYAIVIIFMYQYPYVQLTLISLLNLFLVVFYFYIRPHEKNFENIRNGLSESILIIMQIAITSLVEDKQEEEEADRIKVGWLLIACAGFILFMHIITVVIDLLKALFNLIKDFFITIYQSYKQRKNKKQENSDDKNNKKDINNLLHLPIGEFGSQIAMQFVRSNTKHLSSKILATSPSKLISRKSLRRQTTKLNATFNQIHEDGDKKDLSHNFGDNIPESLKDFQIGQQHVDVSILDASFAHSQLKLDTHKQYQTDKKNYEDNTYREINLLKSADTSVMASCVNIENPIVNLNESVCNNNS